jgi:hypothetical protein
MKLTNDEGILINRGEKVKCLIQGKNIIELYFYNLGIYTLRWRQNKNCSGCLNAYRDSKYLRKDLLCGLGLSGYLETFVGIIYWNGEGNGEQTPSENERKLNEIYISFTY